MSESKKNETQPVKVKRKSRFGKVLGVIIIIIAITFAFIVVGQRYSYSVLQSNSNEVKSKIEEIKDYRTIKGYKVLESSGQHKLVLISAGLTYDKEAKLEVESVDISKDKAKVVVKEIINTDVENEVVTYPYVVLKLSNSVKDIMIENTDGEKYNEIIIAGKDNTVVVESSESEDDDKEKNSSTKKEDSDKDMDDESIEEDEVKEENKEEVVDKDHVSSNTKTVKCIYQGRIDSNSVEVMINGEYATFNVDQVQGAFVDKEIGDIITVEYIDGSAGWSAVKVY